MTRATFASLAATALLGGIAIEPGFADEDSVPRDASLRTLARARAWLNGAPALEALRGRVVLVDVFTFACYNCQNVTPNLRLLERTRRAEGLTIVGIHSPETPEEHERSRVVTNLRRLGITWPVAIDNDFALWNAYHIEAWPTQMIFDRRGHLRKVVVGDSQDAVVDAAVTRLLREPA